MTSTLTDRFLSQRKDPDQFPELSYLGGFYESINLYGSWEFGRDASIRDSLSNSVPPSPLAEDLSEPRHVPQSPGTVPKLQGTTQRAPR